MALTGKPSVIEPRGAQKGDTSAALRPLQDTVKNIRERLRLIEAEANRLALVVADLQASDTGGSTDITDLQSQINVLRTRIINIEAQLLVEWYVNGDFVGTRRKVNFIEAGGLDISGSDDGDIVHITFGAAVDLSLPITRSQILVSGRSIGLVIGA